MDPRVSETAQSLLGAYTGALLPPVRTRFEAGDMRAAYAVQQKSWEAALRVGTSTSSTP